MRKAVVLMAGLALLAGCGDEETNAPLSKATFVEEANRICTERTEEISNEAASALELDSPNPGAGQASNLMDLVSTVLVPGLEGEADELRDLGAPAGDEDRVKAIVNAISEVARKAETNSAQLLQGGKPYAEPEALADEYGLTACPLG